MQALEEREWFRLTWEENICPERRPHRLWDWRKNRKEAKYSYHQDWWFPEINPHSVFTPNEISIRPISSALKKYKKQGFLRCLSVLYSCKLSDVRSHKQHLEDYKAVRGKCWEIRQGYRTGRVTSSVSHQNRRQKDPWEGVTFQHSWSKQDERVPSPWRTEVSRDSINGKQLVSLCWFCLVTQSHLTPLWLHGL